MIKTCVCAECSKLLLLETELTGLGMKNPEKIVKKR